jgi:hypothetical protein
MSKHIDCCSKTSTKLGYGEVKCYFEISNS